VATILVVDDEPVVIEFVQRSLALNGYTYITAVDGLDGWNQFLRHWQEINLVLTDVSMPRMTGPELVNQIRSLDKSMKIVFMTGYSPGQVLPQEIHASCPTLKKPFKPSALIERIQMSLEGCP
jgi:CheY-like chemotaxis protein